MVPADGPLRAVMPVIGTIFLVAVVVVLASTVGIVALGFGEQVSSEQPTTAFETETDSETVAFVHRAGENIPAERLTVEGGTIVSTPTQVEAGDEIAVQPAADKEEVTLVYEEAAGQQTHILESAPVPAGIEDAAEGVVLKAGGLLADHDDQCEAGALDSEFADPVTVQVELNESVDRTETLGVSVRDHLSSCGVPRNGASGTVDVDFKNGVGSFTIQGANTNAGADLDLWLPCAFLGGPCEVNDIESMTVTSSGSVEVERIVVGA